jgi:hypothetical protein
MESELAEDMEKHVGVGGGAGGAFGGRNRRDDDGSALIDLTPGTTSEVNLPALSRSSVKVIVTLDGKPHDHANVWVSLKEWKKHVICQLGAADVNEVGEAILKNLPPVHAQVQCHDDNLGQMHGQPVDLTDPSRTPVIRFEFKSKPKAE